MTFRSASLLDMKLVNVVRQTGLWASAWKLSRHSPPSDLRFFQLIAQATANNATFDGEPTITLVEN